MTDETEAPRRAMLAEINANPNGRAALEARYGQVWDTAQMAEEFEVVGFMAPLIIVNRKADRITGSMMFQASPRFYFGFQPA